MRLLGVGCTLNHRPAKHSSHNEESIMSSDPLLPDLPDVPQDVPPGGDPGSVPEQPNSDPDRHEDDHATGEAQAQENRDREPPA